MDEINSDYMIGSLHQVAAASSLPLVCVSQNRHARSCNARGALLSLLIFVFACVGTLKANAQTWTGSTPTDANGKTVYLYNVGAKKFLGNGERWGTQAITTYEGTPFKLTYSSSKILLQSQVKGQGSSSNGYLAIMDGVASTHDTGNYFTDRPSNDGTNRQITATAVSTDDGSNVYRLTFTTSSTKFSGTYYMAGAEDDVVTSLTTVEADDDNFSEWIIVTEDERKQAFTKAEAANAKPVNATFLMYDFDFARNNQACSYWKTGADQSGTLSWNTSAVRIPTDAQGVTYYTHTYTNTHSATYTSTSGSTSSTKTTHTATYTVTNTLTPEEQKKQTPTITASCGGDSYTSYYGRTTYTHEAEDVEFTYYSSTKSSSIEAYTYYLGNGYKDGDVETGYDPITGDTIISEKNRQCVYGADWTANIHGAEGYVTQTLDQANMLRKGYYRVSCKAFTTATTGKARLWAAASSSNGDGSSDEQDNNAAYAYKALTAITEDIPTTYVKAAQLINAKNSTTYDASVVVYVDDASTKQLTFGIYVNGAEDSAWTCFDAFALQYLGDPEKEYDLVLDEDQTKGDYINAQATPDDKELKTSNLYLHRTMNAGKWNSLVLPVSLTVAQVKSAFGDQVRISQFKGATDETHKGRLIFEKISADRNNESEIAIEAGQLYLVKVDADKEMPSDLEAKTVDSYGISITSYYTIPGVTFKKAVDVKDVDYTSKVEGTTGAETYGSDSQVQFVGTYVKLSDELIPVNSYVLNGNNQGGTAGMWYFRTKETPSKGFRGWLQPYSSNPAKQLEYSVDGEVYTIDNTSTGIQGIVDDLNARESNIYNLNGQLVRANATSHDGLAKGVYIQKGKKFIVK